MNYYVNYDYNGAAEGRSLEIGEVTLESSKNYIWNTANENTNSIDMNNSKGWTHVAITNPVLNDGTKTMDVYINGVYKKSKTLTVTEGATLTSAGIYFGGSATKPSYVNRMKEANYGDLEVYTGVLSEEQIMKVYAETRGNYGIESPNAVAEGPGLVAPDAVSFDFTMKNDMDTDEFADMVLRRESDNTEIAADFSADGTTLTVTPKEYLSYNTEYILDFPSLYCDDCEFTTVATDMKFAAEPSVSQDKIAFELETERSAGTVTVIAVGVDSQGALCGATATVVDLATAKTGTLSETGMSDWNTVKLMIWENGDGYTMPLTEVIEIN